MQGVPQTRGKRAALLASWPASSSTPRGQTVSKGTQQWLSPALVRRACIRWLPTLLKTRRQGIGRTSERR